MMAGDAHEACQAEVDELRQEMAELRVQLEDSVRGKADDTDIDTLRSDLQLAGEALERVWGVLDDMLEAFEVDRGEYEEDLARIQELGRMLR